MASIPPTTVDEAIATLRCALPGAPPTWEVAVACGVLLEACRNGQALSAARLVPLLDHSGLIAECAARCLYVVTGRDSLLWSVPKSFEEDFDMNRDNWQHYLDSSGR
jgi:hypothetical protein